MATKKTQYVLVPAAGLTASPQNPKQMQFFQTLHATSLAAEKTHNVSTESGALPVKVLDSIGETKAKLIEAAPEDLAALRASHPSVRILPVVYYQPAVVRYEIGPRVGSTAAKAKKVAKAAGGISITITSSKGGGPVAGAMVVAFTDFAQRAGAQGTTNAQGRVTLALGGGTKKIERLYVYPSSGFWPGLLRNLTLKPGVKIPVTAIDLSYVDCVRYFYPGNDLAFGRGVTVGVIDSGVATNHAGLVVQGGQNTVPGEKPADFGDNGTEGHGTHVAGIIASRGTPPKGIRGVAPGVALRSYRVFPQGGNNASNYAIAKAIDACVADKCDLINMSLGGGNPDTLTEEALTAAHDAGVVIFAATGNDDRQPVSFPAAFSMCQAVSAMGRKGTFPAGSEPDGSIASPYGKDKKNFLASFSNVGSATDLTGPGVGVISTVPAGFGVMSGTSMATPAETGAAARLLANHKEILSMPRDQNRAAAMITVLATACQLLGFGALDEGKGMISL
jgi:subtilisin